MRILFSPVNCAQRLRAPVVATVLFLVAPHGHAQEADLGEMFGVLKGAPSFAEVECQDRPMALPKPGQAITHQLGRDWKSSQGSLKYSVTKIRGETYTTRAQTIVSGIALASAGLAPGQSAKEPKNDLVLTKEKTFTRGFVPMAGSGSHGASTFRIQFQNKDIDLIKNLRDDGELVIGGVENRQPKGSRKSISRNLSVQIRHLGCARIKVADSARSGQIVLHSYILGPSADDEAGIVDLLILLDEAIGLPLATISAPSKPDGKVSVSWATEISETP